MSCATARKWVAGTIRSLRDSRPRRTRRVSVGEVMVGLQVITADRGGSGGAGGLTGVAVASRQSVRVTGAVVGNGCATLTSVECGMGQVLRRKCRDSWIGPASTARPGNEHTT